MDLLFTIFYGPHHMYLSGHVTCQVTSVMESLTNRRVSDVMQPRIYSKANKQLHAQPEERNIITPPSFQLRSEDGPRAGLTVAGGRAQVARGGQQQAHGGPQAPGRHRTSERTRSAALRQTSAAGDEGGRGGGGGGAPHCRKCRNAARPLHSRVPHNSVTEPDWRKVLDTDGGVSRTTTSNDGRPWTSVDVRGL